MHPRKLFIDEWAGIDLNIKPEITLKTEPEEWIWVDGFKGMNKDMQCHGGFQYELGKRYDMPEGDTVKACEGGFHLCLKLEDVFGYVDVKNNNRFFVVRALVRKSDFDQYGKKASIWSLDTNDKLAAKSIEIVRELTIDEIFEHIADTQDWSIEEKTTALHDGIEVGRRNCQIRKLVSIGYAEPLAEYIVNANDSDGYKLAMALDTQPGVSMDAKITAIFSHI